MERGGKGRREQEQRERQEKKRARYGMRERENQWGVRGRIGRCEERRQTKEKDGSEERLYKGEKESKREYAKMTKGVKIGKKQEGDT